MFNFDTDPFAGSTALQTPGRQVVANELFIPNFNFSADVISFDAAVFGVGQNGSFFNGLTAAVPPGGRNVIVQQTSRCPSACSRPRCAAGTGPEPRCGCATWLPASS